MVLSIYEISKNFTIFSPKRLKIVLLKEVLSNPEVPPIFGMYELQTFQTIFRLKFGQFLRKSLASGNY